MNILRILFSFIDKLKYVVVIIIIVLMDSADAEHGWKANLERQRQMDEIRQEIKVYQDRYNEDTRHFEALDQHDELERVAREQYFMRRPGEDVYIIVDTVNDNNLFAQ